MNCMCFTTRWLVTQVADYLQPELVVKQQYSSIEQG
jgi:hypothetical protein